MITQNLFNKKPKTFMDYEPSKLSSKKDRDTQTKAETKTHDPFGSNVKLVGDNITEKDYYDFLEGFSDPYGEKTEQGVNFQNTLLHVAPKSTSPMFTNTVLHAKPKNATLNSPNTQLQTNANNDALLEGFNNLNGDKKTAGEVLKEFVSETIYEPIQDIGAHVSLHNTAHKQYPWMSFASVLSNVASGAIGNRISSSSAKVAKHKDIINDVSNRYNVPSEIIGGIIFKEQFTKSLPDTLANIDTSYIRKEEIHSTGLGGIRPDTARAAWAKVDPQKELPKTDAELQYKLTHDKQFNIESIAAVLLYEAKNKEIISEFSEASNLTTEQWWKAVAKYNGSDEYARKVYEYLPYITELLD